MPARRGSVAEIGDAGWEGLPDRSASGLFQDDQIERVDDGGWGRFPCGRTLELGLSTVEVLVAHERQRRIRAQARAGGELRQTGRGLLHHVRDDLEPKTGIEGR